MNATLYLLAWPLAIAALIAVLAVRHLFRQGWHFNAFATWHRWPHAIGASLHWEHSHWLVSSYGLTNDYAKEEYGLRLILDLAIIHIALNLYLEQHA